MNEDLKQLRKKLDSNDTFMGAHQIKKIRKREKEIPAWALSNEATQKVLLRAFPRLHTNWRQRKSAARWGAIIHLYYRMNMSEVLVAKELGTTPGLVKITLYRIRIHGAGKSPVWQRPKNK